MILQRLLLNTGNEIIFVSQEDILYCNSEANYTAIYVKNERTYITTKSLKDLEDILEPMLFVRIHNSTIINTSYVEKWKTDEKSDILVMIDGRKFILARRRKQQFLSKFRKV
jgi:two-component system, LytTR family, response regulator